MGVLAIAALQEPTLLRSYGIRLPHQAAAIVAAAMLVVLVGQLPKSRCALPQIAIGKALATLCAGASAVFLGAAELALGRPDAVPEAMGWFAGTALATYPFAIVLAAPPGVGNVARTVAMTAAGCAFVVLAVRFDAGNWSPSVLAATLLAWLAAAFHARASAASNHAHRHPR